MAFFYQTRFHGIRHNDVSIVSLLTTSRYLEIYMPVHLIKKRKIFEGTKRPIGNNRPGASEIPGEIVRDGSLAIYSFTIPFLYIFISLGEANSNRSHKEAQRGLTARNYVLYRMKHIANERYHQRQYGGLQWIPLITIINQSLSFLRNDFFFITFILFFFVCT